MKAGELDRRITLLRAAMVKNALNELVPHWSPLATVFAKYMPLSDGERIRAQQVGAYATARFLVRWSTLTAGLTAKDRLVFAGQVFEISGQKEIGRKVGIELTCAALVDGAGG